MTAPAIALVGFMGAGKSSVGMALAHRLRQPFVDTDALIVEQMGPIADLFAAQGEAAFRALERDVVVRVLGKMSAMPSVVALGGGAVTSADIRAALATVPHVVWLTAPVGVLFARASEGGRPLAADEASFRRLLGEREPLYGEVATVRVDNGAGRTLATVVDDVLSACGRAFPASASGGEAS
jgi:shikimate kinase